MSKSIELTPSQIRAHKNGATMFIFPIERNDVSEMRKYVSDDEIIENLFPLQKGDKDVWIKEKEIACEECNKKQIWYDLDEKESNEQCPYCGHYNKVVADCFKEILEVRAVRAQDMIINDCLKILGLKGTICNSEFELANLVAKEFKNRYNQQLKEQNINRTYEDNDYVILVEVKG